MGCGSSTPQYTEGGGGRTGRPNSNDLTIKPLKPEKPYASMNNELLVGRNANCFMVRPHSFSGSGYDNQKVLLKVILLGDSGYVHISFVPYSC